MTSTDCDAQAKELKRLAAALRALKIVESEDAAWERTPAARVIDCVLSLNRRYDGFVGPRLNDFEKDQPNVRSINDLRTLIESFASPHDFMKETLHYDHEARALVLCKVVKWLAGLPSLEGWAKEARPSDYLELQIRGFGLAGFQYLRILFGADTTKPDIYIIRFVSKHVGRKVSDIQAVYLLERAAKMINVSVRDADTTIWEQGVRTND
jgi:hypothetical protein